MTVPDLTVIKGGRADTDTEAVRESRTFEYPPEWNGRTCIGCNAPITGPRRILIEAITVTNFLTGDVEYWHGLCRAVRETRNIDDGRKRLVEAIFGRGPIHPEDNRLGG